MTTPNAPTLSLNNDSGINNQDGVTQSGLIRVDGLQPDALWQYSTDGGQNWRLGVRVGLSALTSTMVSGYLGGTSVHTFNPATVMCCFILKIAPI
jgi:hypothetical protein